MQIRYGIKIGGYDSTVLNSGKIFEWHRGWHRPHQCTVGNNAYVLNGQTGVRFDNGYYGIVAKNGVEQEVNNEGLRSS